MPGDTAILKRKLRKLAKDKAAFDTLEKLYEAKKAALVELQEEIWEDMVGDDPDNSLKSITIAGVGRFTRVAKGPYCHIKKDEGSAGDGEEVSENYRARFEAWAEKNGLKDVLIKPMPILQRVNRLYRERLEEGLDLPDGIEAIYHKRIQVVKEK